MLRRQWLINNPFGDIFMKASDATNSDINALAHSFANTDSARIDKPTQTIDPPSANQLGKVRQDELIDPRQAPDQVTLKTLATFDTSGRSYSSPLPFFRVPHRTIMQELGSHSYRTEDISPFYKEFPATRTNNIQVIEANKIFKPGTFYIGFGLPNVYLAEVTDSGDFRKVDAKSLKRAPTKIVTTDGRAQSGFLLVPTSIPETLREALYRAAKAEEGESRITCARTSSEILHNAGCRLGSGNGSLKEYVFPHTLLMALLENGLTYENKALPLKLVRTTPLSLKKFYEKIVEATQTTPIRHAYRSIQDPTIIEKRRQAASATKTQNNTLVDRPGIFNDDGNNFHLKTSDTSSLGTIARKLWGAHVIYKIPLPASTINEFLPTKLSPFPQANPNLATQFKKNILFNKSMVGFIRHHMAPSFKDLPEFSERDFLSMLAPSTADKPNVFNVVITGSEIIIGKLNVHFDKVDWILSKHVLLSNYSDDVRFAGEFFKNTDN